MTNYKERLDELLTALPKPLYVADVKGGGYPNPGSDTAIGHGCTCPVLDNGRGSEELGRIRGFYYTVGCPVHDTQEERDDDQL